MKTFLFVCFFVLWRVCEGNSDRYFGIHSSEEIVEQQPSLLESLISHGFGLLGEPSVPTAEPSAEPSAQPSVQPSRGPTTFLLDPSVEPTQEPTASPTEKPTVFTTNLPIVSPSLEPSAEPSEQPNLDPTVHPTTIYPTSRPSQKPSSKPTGKPTSRPSSTPSGVPSSKPSSAPTSEPSGKPTSEPSNRPTSEPSALPTNSPTAQPSSWPSSKPTNRPTSSPSVTPSSQPSSQPSGHPTSQPSAAPSGEPSGQPSSMPTSKPSSWPSSQPTSGPSAIPSSAPTAQPSSTPTVTPSSMPSSQPSSQPTSGPSAMPTRQPSSQPSGHPTSQPTAQPSCEPSSQPSAQPSRRPSSHPSRQPSAQPSTQPSAQPTRRPSPQPTPVPSAPPGSPTCLPTSLPTFTTAAPVINATRSTATRTSITLAVNFTLPAYYPGSVYCAAFANVSTFIVSNDLIIAVGTSGAYAAGQMSTKVTVTGLSALESYATYCTVRTFDGTMSALTATRATKHIVQTTCCKLLSFTLAPSYVYGSLSKYTAGQTKLYVFSYALSSKPGVKVIVTPIVHDSAGNLVSSANLAVLPSSQRFLTNSTGLVGTFALSAASNTFSGTYVITLVPSGQSAAQYRAVNATVRILAASAPPPTPALLTAKFGNSGGTFDVTFDSATNKATLPTSFACSELLSFLGVGSTSCVWSTNSVVRVTFVSANGTLAAPGSQVSLRGGLVKAACASGQNCTAYTAAAAQSTTLFASDSPVVPVVVLQVPSAASSCDDLLIDPSLTSGNGGRAWSSVVWQITKQTSTATSSDTALLSILESFNGSTASVITIPKEDLTVALYTLTLTVTNFLGQVGTASAMFSLDDNPNIPIVTIPGSSVVSIIPSESLSLYTHTSLSSCAEAGVVVAYRWRVFHNNIEKINIVSTSADPSRFLLSPYTLNILTVYTVELTATANATSENAAASASVTFTVRVGEGAVVARVTGGHFRSLVSTAPFPLDASASYDQNFPPGQSATIQSYAWTCRVLSAAQYGEDCENLLPAARTSSVLLVGATPLVANTQYEFTVTVSSPDGRTSSYPVSVQNSPGATLTAINNVNVVKMDPRTRIVLNGFVTGGYALDASWTASIDGAAVTFVASCPLFQQFTASEVLNTLAYPLSIPGNTFVGGTVVSFRLLAYQSGTAELLSSYSDITIFMNAAPSGGVLSVTPPSGLGLNTSFLLMATSWSDEPEDYPLSYEYTYTLIASAPQLTIQSRTGSNKVTSQLPAGLDSQNQLVTLTCAVFDIYLSASTTSAQVAVSISPNLNVNAYVDHALTTALSTGNTDAVSQVIANAASTLNVVNCSNASPSFCAGLNREACYATSQTCSECLDGYVGILGDSNAPCLNASTSATLVGVGSTCTTDAECALNLCANNICAAPVLACPSENADPCSGHGQCTYQDGSGTDYGPVCTILDVTCFAACSCESSYGGASCALSMSELHSRDVTRAKLCNAVFTVGALSDVSYLMLNSLVSGLYSTYDRFEVFSDASVGICTDALMKLSDYAAQGFLSDEATSWILQTTSKFIQPVAINSTTTRRLHSQRALLGTDGNAIDASATAIIAGMLNNMVVGQFASNFASDEMQIIVMKALGSSVTTVTPPATAASAAYGSGLTGSVELSSGTAALVQDTGGFVQVAVLMWGSNPFANSQSLTTPLLRLEISALNVSDQEILALNTTLGNQPAFYVTLQFSTMQDFNFSLTIDEAMVTGAPNFTVPSCATRIPNGYAHCPCAVTTYSNYNVTFGCGLEALFPIAAGDARRRAQSEGSSKIVQFGSVLADLDNELIKYLSKNPFEVDLSKARIVLIFLCALSLVILIGYVIFRYWDVVDQKYLVHEKAARDQRHFKERHAELLAVRKLDHTTSIKAMDWHKDPSNRLADAMSTAFKTHWVSPGFKDSPSKKRHSAEPSGFVDIYSVNSALSEIFDFEAPTARPSNALQIAPNAGQKGVVLGAGKHNTSRGNLYRSESSYSVQYDGPQSGLGSGWEREFFVSNSVSHYLTTILPKGSLGDSPGLFGTLLRYHKYTAAFVGRSLQHTRVLRWTNMCLGLLVTLFINTLIYGIFYPDEGDCQDKLTRDECLSEMSSVYDARLCRWTADITVIDGGNCSLNPPPQYFVFIIVVVLITVLISLPVQFAYEYLLFTVCFRRPRLEFCGLTSEFWLGASTQKGELDQSVQSPLKGLHEEAASKHWTTQRPGNLHRTVSQMFQQEMHPRLEADALLLSVNQALEARIYGENLPWKSVGQTGRSQNLRAIQTRLGIYANGTPVALTGLQWLRFGNRKEELVREIKAVRLSAKKLQAHVDSLDRTDIRGREKMLFQYFILEQFSSFKKFLLRRFLFDFADTTPHMINPFVWFFAWAFVILSMGFFLYWAFIWAASQGGSTAENWGINLGSAIAQDVLVIQVFRVYFIYSLSMLSLKPQLRSIYRVLHRVCVDYAQDQLETDGLEIAVVQHLSPACRASHSEVCAQLSAARVLRHVNDSDVEQCKQSFNARVAIAASAVLSIPLLLAVLSEIAGTSFMESLLPAFLDALIVSNYYFYSAAGLFILVPYLVIFGVFLWYYLFRQVRAASYRHNAFFYSSLETDSDAGVSELQNWNTSGRSSTHNTSTFTNIWQSNQKQLRSWWSGAHDTLMHKFDLQWEIMNRPASLQAVETAISPTSRLKKQQRKSPKEKMSSVEAAKAGMKIPNEVTDMTVGGSGDWLEVWVESSRSPRTSRSGGYLTDLMNRNSSQRHPVSRRFSQDSSAGSTESPPLQLSAPLPRQTELQDSDSRASFGTSFLGTSQRGFTLQRTFSDDRHRLDPVDEDALDSILNNFRFCVQTGRMGLVDPDESKALAEGTATTCDVLVEFFDLRILLEEHLAQQKPYGRALSAEEKSRIVDSCYNWVSGLGDEMLKQHYNQDVAKIAAATLLRKTSSFSPPNSPIATSRAASSKPYSGSSRARRDRERINFSVPFQEFRRWAQHSGGMLSGINQQDSRSISRRSSKSFGGSVRLELDL